ncbi:MAG TPA: ferredoxin [Burkholderiales bacterium]|nr:ferredoxin [Burkholderiales bacterium]
MSDQPKLRIRVEPERCQGHNRCHAIAPELFELDDYGYSRAAGDGAVPPRLEDKARLAVKNCPEHAVHLTKGG